MDYELSSRDLFFKIDASRCRLRIGDRVTAETIIGESFKSGDPVEARCEGRVEGIGFNPDDHALIVWVRAESCATREDVPMNLTAYKIDANRCRLRTGELVTSETTVGEDWKTGATVKAGRHGRVERIDPCLNDHALVVVIGPLPNSPA